MDYCIRERYIVTCRVYHKCHNYVCNVYVQLCDEENDYNGVTVFSLVQHHRSFNELLFNGRINRVGSVH